jgi:hypothetical protein
VGVPAFLERYEQHAGNRKAHSNDCGSRGHGYRIPCQPAC